MKPLLMRMSLSLLMRFVSCEWKHAHLSLDITIAAGGYDLSTLCCLLDFVNSAVYVYVCNDCLDSVLLICMCMIMVRMVKLTVVLLLHIPV